MDYEKIKKMDEVLKQLMAEIRAELKAEFQSIPPMNGVRVTGPRTAIVSSSSIFSSKGCIMAPSYYLPSVQADALEAFLLKDGLSIEKLQERLNTVLHDGSVPYRGEKIVLNPNTLEALRKIQDKMK